MATVLFVGSRRGALRAAARLGIEVLLLASRRPAGLPARRFARIEPRASAEEIVAAALSLAARHPPDAVVASTEQSVVPAG